MTSTGAACSKRSVNVVEHASQKQDSCPPPSPPQSKLSGAPGLRESQSSRASRARRHVGLGNEAEVGWTLFGPVPTETSDNINRRGREGGDIGTSAHNSVASAWDAAVLGGTQLGIGKVCWYDFFFHLP